MSDCLQNLSDSYKYCHYQHYPKDMIGSHFYFEGRSDKNFPKLVFFGLQYYIRKYLSTDNLWMENMAATQTLCNQHGLPFNIEDWEYLYHLERFPIRIVGKPEGSICDIREPLFTVESMDPKVAWLPGFLETLLVKVWYPCTVATKAYYARQMLEGYAKDNLDPTNQGWVDFAYHNFGDRGSTSVESAAIGGAAHLVFFKGTDNFNSLNLINDCYPDFELKEAKPWHNEGKPRKIKKYQPVGFSIPATEHSVMTAWGRDGEDGAILDFVTKNTGKYPIIACVMDSYDVLRAVDYVTAQGSPVRAALETGKTKLVIRPDSGEPIQVLEGILKVMAKNEVKHSLNSHGLRVFDNYRIIWGDGITVATIDTILNQMVEWGFSPENMAFGSGGDLMQNCNRDTLGFAYKLSAVEFEGKQAGSEWFPVCKDPVTDPGKKSKAGLQKINQGVVYYEDGVTADPLSFSQVRRNAGL